MGAIEGVRSAPPPNMGVCRRKSLNLATNISKILHIFNQIDVLKKSFSLQ